MEDEIELKWAERGANIRRQEASALPPLSWVIVGANTGSRYGYGRTKAEAFQACQYAFPSLIKAEDRTKPGPNDRAPKVIYPEPMRAERIKRSLASGDALSEVSK